MIINVGEGGAGKAQSVKYDNSTSKLSADNVQGAIDELDVELKEVKTSFQDGCNTIVSGITAQGVTPKSNSPADIVTAVNTVATNKYNAGVTATKVGNAGVAHVLSGKTFTNSSGVGLTGTMANKGAVTGSITTSGGTYTIPAGYHSGSGKVTGPTLAGLVGTNVTLASAGNLLSGVTAYGKNGTKYTGSMTNRGAWTNTPTTKGKVTIPAGYHNGSGYVDTTSVYNQGISDEKLKQGILLYEDINNTGGNQSSNVKTLSYTVTDSDAKTYKYFLVSFRTIGAARYAYSSMTNVSIPNPIYGLNSVYDYWATKESGGVRDNYVETSGFTYITGKQSAGAIFTVTACGPYHFYVIGLL